MGKDLQAENLTISVPNKGCNRDCPYCISKITGPVEADFHRMCRNTGKVRTVAASAGVTSVLFTGKGEPLLAMKELLQLSAYFRDYPLELQTNGILLTAENILALSDAGFNTIAISVDSPSQILELEDTAIAINALDIMVRLTVNMTHKFQDIEEGLRAHLIGVCKRFQISQLLLRRLTAPDSYDLASHLPNRTTDWIIRNAWGSHKFYLAEKALIKGGRKIRQLSHGVTVYDVEGISVVVSDYCIQEEDQGSDLRSLIFMEDGHLYTKWNSKASRLF